MSSLLVSVLRPRGSGDAALCRHRIMICRHAQCELPGSGPPNTAQCVRGTRLPFTSFFFWNRVLPSSVHMTTTSVITAACFSSQTFTRCIPVHDCSFDCGEERDVFWVNHNIVIRARFTARETEPLVISTNDFQDTAPSSSGTAGLISGFLFFSMKTIRISVVIQRHEEQSAGGCMTSAHSGERLDFVKWNAAPLCLLFLPLL